MFHLKIKKRSYSTFRLAVLDAANLKKSKPELVEKHNYSALKDFRDCFGRVDPSIQLHHFKVYDNQFPSKVSDFDGYLISGSPHSAYDSLDWVQNLKQFVKSVTQDEEIKAPRLVGVCFGHQIISESLLPSSVGKSEKGWGIGAREINILHKFEWMEPFKSKVTLYLSHQDQVMNLSERAVHVGRSEFCENDMSVWFSPSKATPKAFSFQPHIEYSPPFLTDLYNSRRDLIERFKEGRTDQAIKELEKPADNDVVTKWCVNFLKL